MISSVISPLYIYFLCIEINSYWCTNNVKCIKSANTIIKKSKQIIRKNKYKRHKKIRTDKKTKNQETRCKYKNITRFYRYEIGMHEWSQRKNPKRYLYVHTRYECVLLTLQVPTNCLASRTEDNR